jgi:peptide/nickel transport system substrate-binding protein
VVPDGVSTCTNPGTGPGHCGQGVAAGAKASFALLYASGALINSQEAQVLKSDLAKAGIQINLSQAPFNTVITDATPCSPGQACPWEMAFWGGGWVYSPDFYPTGDELWSTGAGSNTNGYTSLTNDANTVATLTSNAVQPLYKYEDFLAKDLPVIWFPVFDYQLTEVKSNLNGVDPQDPLLTVDPESWYFTK